MTELLVTILVVSGIMAGALLMNQSQDVRSEATGGAVDFEFVPQTTTMNVGEEMTFSLFVFPQGERVTAMDLPIVFDSEVFELVSIETTDLFKSVVYGPEEVTNGIWTSVAHVPEGLSEQGEVLRVTLAAKKPVNEGLVTLATDSTNVAALTRLSNNVLGTVSPAVVTVR